MVILSLKYVSNVFQGSLLFLVEGCAECVLNASMSTLRPQDIAKKFACILYMSGSSCYLAGGFLSQLKYADGVPIQLWTAAGVLFSLGSFIQIFKAK
eukprot:m.356326 g.356326  ORF g.356326 m.356326 type:complete len:97 (-) comp90154_c0_seq1:131-421(-)